MKRSSTKILTTHVGSLPRPNGSDDWVPKSEAELREAVAGVVARQKAIGIDVVNEGEYAKGGSWLAYIEERFGGCEPRPSDTHNIMFEGKDREMFAEFYRDAATRGTLFYSPPGQERKGPRLSWACTGPIVYKDMAALQREIDLFRPLVNPEDAFITATAPASLEPYRRNEYYASQEEFLYAFADALRVEYEAIASAGFILQVDDAWLPALWDRIGIQMGLEAFRKWCMVRVEVLNHALANIPEDRIRYHLCWGSWHGPHAFDLEMINLVDVMLRVKAQAYVIEGANARHEHEYIVWDEVKLPPGKILIPGVITHSTDLIEHPELVSQRIQRFAKRVGKENVIAGADCGFGGRSHPQIAFAKLEALVAGAERASKALGY